MLGPITLGTLCSFQSHWSWDLTQPSCLQSRDGGSASPLFTEGVEWSWVVCAAKDQGTQVHLIH